MNRADSIRQRKSPGNITLSPAGCPMSLDPHQLAAVETDAPRVLCLAAPGAGKTRVLVERICWLLDESRAAPSEILALTFTRKAAAEMRSRLGARRARTERVRLTTFHAWCAQICRTYADLIGYPANFTVRDEQDRADLIVHIGRELRLKHKSARRLWAEDAVRDRYATLLRESAALDFDALEGFALQILRERAAEIRGSTREVLVDEGQDTSSVQQEILDLLDPAGLFVVGDPGQSIYGFRGANMAGFLALGKRPGWVTVTLPTNYRSAPAIVEAASRLGRCMSPVGLEQVAARPPVAFAVRTRAADADGIADDIHRVTEYQGNPWGNVAILAPTWRALENIGEKLTEAGIPWRLAKPVPDLWESDEARLLMAVLQAASNPHDVLALQSAVRPWVGLADWSGARAAALRQGCSPLPLLPVCPGRDAVREAIGCPDVQIAVQAAGTPLLEWLQSQHLESRADRLLTVAHAAICAGHRDVHELLDWYAARHLEAEAVAEVPPDAVTLTTIHSAKGLEWPLVWLLLESTEIPRSGDEEKIEEARRLAYVGLTRARDAVTLCWEREPSNFVAEMLGREMSDV